MHTRQDWGSDGGGGDVRMCVDGAARRPWIMLCVEFVSLLTRRLSIPFPFPTPSDRELPRTAPAVPHHIDVVEGRQLVVDRTVR
ncbi:hypothetical protein E2C01_015015 [Portunus trituberculatus]|uniref:Uncharacterized protein n=1 Tax=Portunus trituberculatus TaxID=210409 RepID=A0A5B7DKJ5_PORTR|nr:hypothetical protein [Portunus trituberculatus]